MLFRSVLLIGEQLNRILKYQIVKPIMGNKKYPIIGIGKRPDGNLQGTFRRDGSWLEGELRECDPQLCGWVGGPQIENHRVGKIKQQ